MAHCPKKFHIRLKTMTQTQMLNQWIDTLVHHLSCWGGVPCPCSGWGTPHDLAWVLPILTWLGYPPVLTCLGYPLSDLAGLPPLWKGYGPVQVLWQWWIQDFPEEGALTPKGRGCQPIIWPIFPENCMKMKKFWARVGARVPRAPPLDPPLYGMDIGYAPGRGMGPVEVLWDGNGVPSY